jgi:Bifunctional DNA primase/polymerase, N-terminal
MPDASTEGPLKKEEVPLVRHALMLAKRGMAVFPCLPGMKEPATKHGFLEATTDEGQIRRWWREDPDYNIGIATGVKSGIWVLDIDGGEGEAALHKLEQQYGPTPNSVEAISGGSGRHLFFKLPPDRTIRNSIGKVAEHVDVRASGGYVIVAPSLHPSGRRYRWSVDSANTFAGAPDWLLDRAAEPRKATTSRTAATVTSAEWANLVGTLPKASAIAGSPSWPATCCATAWI